MMCKDITCSFTGPRPHKLPPGTDCAALYRQLEREIRSSIHAGYTVFQSGMAMGIDIVAAELVARLKGEFPHIRLHGILPCATQADHWPQSWRERYFGLLAKADATVCLQTHYSRDCMLRRNRAMVDRCSRLIAVHDGQTTAGGTAYTVRYARATGVEVVLLGPLDYRVAAAPDKEPCGYKK